MTNQAIGGWLIVVALFTVTTGFVACRSSADITATDLLPDMRPAPSIVWHGWMLVSPYEIEPDLDTPSVMPFGTWTRGTGVSQQCLLMVYVPSGVSVTWYDSGCYLTP